MAGFNNIKCKTSNKKPVISEHAKVRYLERVLGFNFDTIYYFSDSKKIKYIENNTTIDLKTIEDCICDYNLKVKIKSLKNEGFIKINRCVNNNKFTLIIRNSRIVTIII